MYGYPLAWTPSTKGVLAGTPIYVADKTAAEIEALGEKLRGAIVLASKPQTVFATADRLQPADADRPVRIGGPEPSATRQEAPVTPANTLNMLLQRFGAGAVLRPGNQPHGTVTVGGSPNTRDDAVPTVMVVAEHYNMIVRMLQAGRRRNSVSSSAPPTRKPTPTATTSSPKFPARTRSCGTRW
jgi:hypothetical protein